MDLMGASEFESSWPRTRISRFQAICSSSCSGRLTSASKQQRVGRAVLAEDGLAQQPARAVRRRSEWSGRARQAVFQAQFARAAAEAAGMGQAQQLDAGVVDQLEQVFAVEGKQRRVHHFEDAGQQRRGLERTHALLLQQIGERVDLGGQLAERVLRCRLRGRGRSNRPRAATRPRWRASAGGGPCPQSARRHTSSEVKQQAAASRSAGARAIDCW
jgi:hypothetical protein